jgi:hypothetical protein
MACVNHPEALETTPCASCQRPFCAACLRTFQGLPVCASCREYREATARAGLGPPAATTAGVGPAAAPSGQPGFIEHVIPARNPSALVGYYVAVFSLIPAVGALLGPAAVVLGMFGLRARRDNPNMPGKGHAITAIVLGAITTLANWGLVLFVLGGSLFSWR